MPHKKRIVNLIKTCLKALGNTFLSNLILFLPANLEIYLLTEIVVNALLNILKILNSNRHIDLGNVFFQGNIVKEGYN